MTNRSFCSIIKLIKPNVDWDIGQKGGLNAKNRSLASSRESILKIRGIKMYIKNKILVKPVNPDSSDDMLNLDLKIKVKCNREPKCAKVTYRDIAKMLTYAMPIKLNPDEFLQMVEDTIKAIEAMPKQARTALKMGYLFSSRVPESEHDDFMQELTLKLLQIQVEDEKLAYTIARCDWVDWWRRYEKHDLTFTSLEGMLECRDNEGNEYILADLVIGAMEYETRSDCKAKKIMQSIPKNILEIGAKRLSGQALNAAERKALSRFIASNPMYYLYNT
jgi:hypothetical protein